MRSHLLSRYTYTKRNIYYFRRKIPKDLRQHYSCDKIVISLRTKSARVASSKALALASSLDDYWCSLRWAKTETVLSRFTVSSSVITIGSSAPTLKDSEHLYLSLKGVSKPKTFRHTVERAVRYLIEAVSDKPIDAFTRSDANAYRDHLLSRGLSPASAKKNISVIRAMLNFAVRENELEEIKAFSSVFFDEAADIVEKRKPVPLDVIQRIQSECITFDDPARWLIALISDTGMRLSEAAGLCRDDVHLIADTPYIRLVEHPWRRLKTKGSQRLIPLVGQALWAVERALECTDSHLLFPKYCTNKEVLSNSASAALNKWLKKRVPDGCVIHSFRHSMRDRLRAVECPPDIIDRIGGWSRKGIGESYGDGYPVDVLYRWLLKLI